MLLIKVGACITLSGMAFTLAWCVAMTLALVSLDAYYERCQASHLYNNKVGLWKNCGYFHYHLSQSKRGLLKSGFHDKKILQSCRT